jgi:hypothetical protein
MRGPINLRPRDVDLREVLWLIGRCSSVCPSVRTSFIIKTLMFERICSTRNKIILPLGPLLARKDIKVSLVGHVRVVGSGFCIWYLT